MSAYIVVKDAVKQFKETRALDHVNLSLEQGRIHGIIGRNGSGKTVLLKCICGFMELTEGSIMIDGKAVQHNKQQNMGIIIESPGFIGSVSGHKNLKYLAGLSGTVSKERIQEVLEIVGLSDIGTKPVRKYSMGMRQRLGIAQAILEDPPLLLLDEPMNGLDNKGVAEIRELLMKLRDEGKTILLASHGKEDIEILCDDVYELDHGRLVETPDHRDN